MDLIKKFKLWFAPAVTIGILAVFVVGSAILYRQTQSELQEKESSIVARAIALNLVGEIQNITQALNTLSQVERANFKHDLEVYNAVSTTLYNKYPGFFYGINFINPKGVIEKIYPADDNKLALGKNLMERPEIRPYLEASLKSKSTAITHRELTYQGVYATIIYEPLYDEKDEFRGWLNVLIDIDVWLENELKAQGWSDFYIQIHWANSVHDLVHGQKGQPKNIFSYDFEVINQKITMKVGLPESKLAGFQENLLHVRDIAGLFMLILVSVLLCKLVMSHARLTEANQKLNLKNILLNSLVHDASSPLTSVSLNLEQATEKGGELTLTSAQKERVLKSMNTLNEMLQSVRALSRLEVEEEALKTQSVSVAVAVEEAISRLTEVAERKKIRIDIGSIGDHLLVRAHENTLINNVIPNVLTNAIKFSKPNSKIEIEVKKSGPAVWILIKDEGQGFLDKEITNFNENGHAIKSRTGSSGEIGSGLGLSQVKGFMKLYGGEAFLENSEKGAIVKLKFQAV